MLLHSFIFLPRADLGRPFEWVHFLQQVMPHLKKFHPSDFAFYGTALPAFGPPLMLCTGQH